MLSTKPILNLKQDRNSFLWTMKTIKIPGTTLQNLCCGEQSQSLEF